jgi:hypothetical protein
VRKKEIGERREAVGEKRKKEKVRVRLTRPGF